MIWINKKLRSMREEEGFTLIELMVVVLIIAILIAIAIPTFLGARKRAQDRAAQSSARNAVTAAKAIFTDREDYSPATDPAFAGAVDTTPANGVPDEMDDGEPALQFVGVAGNSTDHLIVSVTSDNTAGGTKDTRFVAAVKSDSGYCWFVQDVAGPSGVGANGGTRWARSALNPATCRAQDAPAIGAGNDVAGGWWRKAGDAR